MKKELSSIENAVARFGMRIEILSNRSALIEGSSGILDYSPEKVSVKAGRVTADIIGSDLKIICYTDSGIRVEGLIKSVNYGYGG